MTKDIEHCIVFASDRQVTHLASAARFKVMLCFFLPVSLAPFLSSPWGSLVLNDIYEGVPVSYRITHLHSTPITVYVLSCSLCTQENLNRMRTQ